MLITNSGRIEIHVFYQGEFWDIVQDFDISICRNSQGQYYCSDCQRAYDNGINRSKPILLDTKEKLLKIHSFNPLLEWANENFRLGKILCLGGRGDSSTWARIKEQDLVDENDWFFICPLVAY